MIRFLSAGSFLRWRPSAALVLAAAAASTATQCDDSPRGVAPSPATTAVVRLVSRPAPDVPADRRAAFEACLERMNGQNNVEASWRNFETVTLFPDGTNVFATRFGAVPTNSVLTMTVHDRNECRRDPDGDGHVTTGVTVNDTTLDRTVGMTDALIFMIDDQGVVSVPPA